MNRMKKFKAKFRQILRKKNNKLCIWDQHCVSTKTERKAHNWSNGHSEAGPSRKEASDAGSVD